MKFNHGWPPLEKILWMAAIELKTETRNALICIDLLLSMALEDLIHL